jgi:hypothetical protein
MNMNAASKLTKEALEHEKQISALTKTGEESATKYRDEIYRLRYGVYEPQLGEIRRQMDEALRALEAQQKVDQEHLRAEVIRLKQAIDKVQRILLFLRLKPRALAVEDDAVKTYKQDQGKYKEALPYLLDDDYLKIKLFIVENGKPKNKYSLCAVGDTIFPENLLRLRRGYGCPFYTGNMFSLETLVRDGASVQELKTWLAKNYFTLQPDLTGDYFIVKLEYLAAVQDYKVMDFGPLLLATCECGFFHTIFDDLGRRGEVITCPKCAQTMKEV